jgi:hypothetical protein
MAQPKPDALSGLDTILATADITASPWYSDLSDGGARKYDPDRDLLQRILQMPIAAGYADEQQSGRVAKALDAWVAHELRRGGFPEHAVFPRSRQPRVLSGEFAALEAQLDIVMQLLSSAETKLKDAGEGTYLRPVPFRHAVAKLRKLLPGGSDSNILGRFYVKEVDVVVSDWRRGPDVLISTKTQFSSYLNNKNNRYEEAIGEAVNLRDRYPMAAMGYVFLVRDNVFEERAFELLRDLLVRLRKPDGPFDATMLLVATWDDELTLGWIEDPADKLKMPTFFSNILDAVMTNTPVDIHQELRRRRLGEEPPGGFPPPEDDVMPDAALLPGD